jgi:hypothetical protein
MIRSCADRREEILGEKYGGASDAHDLRHVGRRC